MEAETIARWVIIAGVVITITGAVLWLIARTGVLGRLPGDIVIERDGLTVFFPLATMLIISLILTVIINIIVRLR
jgi:hypothetical protein